MKKVLIISFFFSDKSIIGAVRPNGLAKFLPEFGWEPVVLTVESETKSKHQFTVIETPYVDLFANWKKRFRLNENKSVKENLGLPTRHDFLIDFALDIWNEIFAFPDANIGWYKFAVSQANELLRENKFDAIISTSRPATTHLIAKDLKMKYGTPWIADFRDLWTQNHTYSFSPIRKLFERKLELETLSEADLLTTVSKPLAENLRKVHKNKDIYVIPNGFDPDQMSTGNILTKDFSITYTGSIYKRKQDPIPFFKALSGLILEGSINEGDISVNFYGDNINWIENDIAKFGLHDIVKVNRLISRDKAIEKQKESQILLFLSWNDPQEKGICTGKIFDYISSQRPILSVGSSGGAIENLLRITQSGTQANNSDEIIRTLTESYREFKLDGKVNYRGVNSEIDKYNHREMARKFAKILNNL